MVLSCSAVTTVHAGSAYRLLRLAAAVCACLVEVINSEESEHGVFFRDDMAKLTDLGASFLSKCTAKIAFPLGCSPEAIAEVVNSLNGSDSLASSRLILEWALALPTTPENMSSVRILLEGGRRI